MLARRAPGGTLAPGADNAILVTHALTGDQRDTLTLHFFEGYTFDEIALKLGQSFGNIRNHYYRGLDKLRKQMFPGKLPGRNGYGRK